MLKDLLFINYTGENVISKEQKYADCCIEYYGKFLKNDSALINRHKLYNVIKDFYSKIKIELNPSQELFLKNSVVNPETIFLEVAHDGQIPHLGIVRLVLKTYHISTLIPNSMVIYFIGDHYSAEMCAESTLFGIPQMGVSPNKQRSPVVIKIGRKNQHVPLKWISVPSEQMIDEIKKNVIDWIVNNISYEKNKGRTIKDIEKIEDNLEKIFRILKENARQVDNYGDWIIRIQYILFKELMGEEINRIIFLPFSDMTKLAEKEFLYYLRETEKINLIKKDVSEKQLNNRLIPYQKTEIPNETISFWLYCPNCKRRTRPERCEDGTIKFKCRVCSTELQDSINNLWDIIMPDIIAFENAYFRLGIGGWVIGSEAPYQEVIAAVYKTLYSMPMPPRFLLKSVPVFRGIGDPEEGYGRTTLMRALLESSNEKLFRMLMSPWDENPNIESNFLVTNENRDRFQKKSAI